MLYGPVAHQLLVRSSRAISDFLIPSLPYSLSTFAALLLKHMILAASITAHHLYLTENISQADPLAYCKPIPQTPSDQDVLLASCASSFLVRTVLTLFAS